ncbi:MAG: nucleotidyl transferase AbiEii/AbiGii toxin family protein [Candidatus Omnitrophota bacterium]
MNKLSFDQLQLREIFHLEFLACLGRKLNPECYVLKGGANLRFFFNSIRYSEGMDLDVRAVEVYALKDIVMDILNARIFKDSLIPFGIEKIVLPDISKAKQTETTQRFKVHLLTASGEDLFTKVEFSRRGFMKGISIQPVSGTVLRVYKLSPLLLPHYDAGAAILQKIKALALRSVTQARDVFDLYILSPQLEPGIIRKDKEITQTLIGKAMANALGISFQQFRDVVLAYLFPRDKLIYDKPETWDEIKLTVSDILDKIGRTDA